MIDAISTFSFRIRSFAPIFTLSKKWYWFISLVAMGISHANSQENTYTSFKRDSFTLEYPSSWKYVEQSTPDGNVLHMFSGPQINGFMPYCHVTQQPLSPTLNVRSTKMSKNEIRDFFLSYSDFQSFRSIYSAVSTAPKFNLLNIGPSTLGKTVPGMAAEFTYQIPAGFHYRVRSLFTFWPKAQLSVWCQATSKSLANAETGYHTNLAIFQRFFANVRIAE